MQRLYPPRCSEGDLFRIVFQEKEMRKWQAGFKGGFPRQACQLDSIERVIPDSRRIRTLDRLATQPRFLATIP